MKHFCKILFVFCWLGCIVNCSVVRQSSAVEIFEENEIVPDVIPVPPPVFLEINFPNGVSVEGGVELTPTQVSESPFVSWDAEDDVLYTLIFVDPDAPTRVDPSSRSIAHWVVGNILGSDLESGDVVFEFVGSGPRQDSGLHRYVFLLYEQSELATFDMPDLSEPNNEYRRGFSVVNFVNEYGLLGPIAGNFYQAQWEDVDENLH